MISDVGGNSFGRHKAVQGFAGCIGSETGNESSVGSSTTAGDCLIQTFTAGVFCVIGSENCFTG
jgi:hypothetical protein